MALKKQITSKTARGLAGKTVRPRKAIANPSGLIDAYEVFYASNGFAPRIALKRQGNYVASLFFRPDGSTLPGDTQQDGQAMIHYHQQNFHNVIDVLRNEAPVYLEYLGDGGGFENHLRTIR